MARLGWAGSVATALGVAAGTGAAQLGFGYGLGIINWAPPGGTRVEATWVASLAWATWISATSVVAGAVCAHRLRGEDEEPGRALRNLTLAAAAAVGALITVLLVAVPARAARVPDTFSPETVAAGYAAVGLLIGLLLAVWALHSRAAAGNLIATTGWLWLLAVVSVVDGVRSGRGLAPAQLGSWQLSAASERFWIRDYFYWPGALLALGSALVIGVLAARRTARMPERRIGAAASGAAGPILVALAYLLAVPRLTAIAPEQLSAHLIAPYAVIAGLGGSVLVAALAQRTDSHTPAPAGVTVPDQRADEPADLAAGAEAADDPDAPATSRAGSAGEPTTSPIPAARPARPGPPTPSGATTTSATADDQTGEPAGPRGVSAVRPGSGKSARTRDTGGRARAVPAQRAPSDPFVSGDEAGGDAATSGGAPSTTEADPEGTPVTGAKARRRSR